MIGISTFVYAGLQRVAKFEAWWQEMHTADPDNFPMWMSEGEWEEQYMCWTETDEEINLFNSH